MKQTIILTALLWIGVILPAQATDAKILQAINRLSFGPRPGEVARVESIGLQAYIQEQLYPEKISLPSNLSNKLVALESLGMTTTQLGLAFGQASNAANRQELRQKRQDARSIVEEAQQARLMRAIESPRQLEEVLVDFWYNHFNVAATKGISRVWIGNYEQQAIRPHVFGKFRDLLGATARHPAMLYYLDNWRNVTPKVLARNPRGRTQGLNENYARELMELHTLGVKGGYSQQDVTTLTKILTGWGYRRYNPQTPEESFVFFFDEKRHDTSPKIFLGKPIKATGQGEVEEALDMLAASPATAKYISYKLAQYFVSDDPSSALVAKMQQRWLKTGGDVRSVLSTMLEAPEFWNSNNSRSKFKTPYQYVVSTIRASGLEVTNFKPLVNQLATFGMPLYHCTTPDGYKNTKSAWLSETALVDRVNFAVRLSGGQLALGLNANRQPQNSSPIDSSQLRLTLGNFISSETQKKIAANNNPNLQSALLLGSPDFMYR
jgi:uncharacterized protein (DUF1800 family)